MIVAALCLFHGIFKEMEGNYEAISVKMRNEGPQICAIGFVLGKDIHEN